LRLSRRTPPLRRRPGWRHAGDPRLGAGQRDVDDDDKAIAAIWFRVGSTAAA